MGNKTLRKEAGTYIHEDQSGGCESHFFKNGVCLQCYIKEDSAAFRTENILADLWIDAILGNGSETDKLSKELIGLRPQLVAETFPRNHGTEYSYKHKKCRCDACKKAHSDLGKEQWKQRKQNGRTNS